MIEQDERVRHPKKPEWGLGRVLEVFSDGKARILFEHAGEKLLRPDVAGLEVVTGDDAKSAVLDYVRIGKDRRTAPTAAFADLVSTFREKYPGGFDDPKYLEDERDYKLKARAFAVETLSHEALESALMREDYAEICRHAYQVVTKTNLLFRSELITLKSALDDSSHQAPFARALADVLYGAAPFADRFDAWSGALAEIGAKHWTTATYFTFLLEPERHMFMKPSYTQRAAQACGRELNYRTEPNSLTYDSLVALAMDLKGKLAELGVRDFVDVQSFGFVNLIWSSRKVDDDRVAR